LVHPRDRFEQFSKTGGKFIAPTDDDLRTLVALRAIAARNLDGFDGWLRARKPLFDTSLFKTVGLCPPPFLSSQSPTQVGRSPGAVGTASIRNPVAGKMAPTVNKQTKGAGSGNNGATQQKDGPPEAKVPGCQATRKAGDPRQIAIGRRFEHGTLGDSVMLAAELLRRHVAILAGSGSGKTVLLRRIIEEAALIGIPSVVLDINNDLSQLGEPWPARPDEFGQDAACQAAAYHARTDVVVWTPGVSSGNPVSLNLLPHFAGIGDKHDTRTEDERAQAVEMARATLSPYLGLAGQKAYLKQGVLADALRAFAKSGGRALDDLIGFLFELPEDVSKIGSAPKLAAEVANQLLAAIATNPLLHSPASTLDPQMILADS
jgi:hypothetical protein